MYNLFFQIIPLWPIMFPFMHGFSKFNYLKKVKKGLNEINFIYNQWKSFTISLFTLNYCNIILIILLTKSIEVHEYYFLLFFFFFFFKDVITFI